MPVQPKKRRKQLGVFKNKVPFKKWGSSNQKFYNSPLWKKVRVLIKLEQPLCVECHKKGNLEETKVIDHIIRMQDGGSPYDKRNLQGLCHRCHNVKSGKERHGYKIEFKLNEENKKIPR